MPILTVAASNQQLVSPALFPPLNGTFAQGKLPPQQQTPEPAIGLSLRSEQMPEHNGATPTSTSEKVGQSVLSEIHIQSLTSSLTQSDSSTEVSDESIQVDQVNEVVHQTSSVVGPDGGEMKVGGCELRIPEGALNSEVTIKLQSTYRRNDEKGLITPMLKCEPHGLKFYKMVIVRLPTCYVSDEPARVEVRRSEDGCNWKVIKELHHTDGKHFEFSINGFSLFDVMFEDIRWWWSSLLRKSLTYWIPDSACSVSAKELRCFVDDDIPGVKRMPLNPESYQKLIFFVKKNEEKVKISLSVEDDEQSSDITITPSSRHLECRQPRAETSFKLRWTKKPGLYATADLYAMRILCKTTKTTCYQSFFITPPLPEDYIEHNYGTTSALVKVMSTTEAASVKTSSEHCSSKSESSLGQTSSQKSCDGTAYAKKNCSHSDKHDTSQGVCRAIHILRPEPNGSYSIDHDQLERVFGQEDAVDLPVAIVSVAGAPRSGKSFILNFFLRFLKAAKEEKSDSWLENKSEELDTGFAWRGGFERHTQGIWVWNEPFFVETPKHGKVALFLMDTEGAFDISIGGYSDIFVLSTFISSIQISNVIQQLQSDAFQHLQLFTEYGKFARSLMRQHESTEEHPFQGLLFLVRDWYDPDLEYGFSGGDYVLAKVFEDQQTHEVLGSVAQSIQECFENVECFLMPWPGRMVTRRGAHESPLVLQDVDSEFLQQVDILARGLFSPENLVVKKVNGNVVTGKGLVNFSLAFCETFQSNEIPHNGTILEASMKAAISTTIHESLNIYDKSMNEMTREGYNEPKLLADLHEQSKAEALKWYDEQQELSESDKERDRSLLITCSKKNLAELIDHKFVVYKKWNISRRIFEVVDQTSLVIGPAGDEIKVRGCELRIPEGALDSEITITLQSVHRRKREGLLTPVVKCEPNGLKFHKPAVIRLYTCYIFDEPVKVEVRRSEDGKHWEIIKQFYHTNERHFEFFTRGFSWFEGIIDRIDLWWNSKIRKSLICSIPPDLRDSFTTVLTCSVDDDNGDVKKNASQEEPVYDTYFCLKKGEENVEFALSIANIEKAVDLTIDPPNFHIFVRDKPHDKNSFTLKWGKTNRGVCALDLSWKTTIEEDAKRRIHVHSPFSDGNSVDGPVRQAERSSDEGRSKKKNRVVVPVCFSLSEPCTQRNPFK